MNRHILGTFVCPWACVASFSRPCPVPSADLHNQQVPAGGANDYFYSGKSGDGGCVTEVLGLSVPAMTYRGRRWESLHRSCVISGSA